MRTPLTGRLRRIWSTLGICSGAKNSSTSGARCDPPEGNQKMALTRTSIRDKLNLLLLVPLLATMSLAVSFVALRVDEARAASLTASTATTAEQIADLLYVLQGERLSAMEHIVAGRGHRHSLMLRQQAVVDDAVADLLAGLGPRSPRGCSRRCTN
jgi:hypothetical protein